VQSLPVKLCKGVPLLVARGAGIMEIGCRLARLGQRGGKILEADLATFFDGLVLVDGDVIPDLLEKGREREVSEGRTGFRRSLPDLDGLFIIVPFHLLLRLRHVSTVSFDESSKSPMEPILIIRLNDVEKTVAPKTDKNFDVSVPLRNGIVLEGIVACFHKVFPGFRAKVLLEELKTEISETQYSQVILDCCLAQCLCLKYVPVRLPSVSRLRPKPQRDETRGRDILSRRLMDKLDAEAADDLNQRSTDVIYAISFTQLVCSVVHRPSRI